MLDDEEKQEDPSSPPAEVALLSSPSPSPYPRLTPLYSVTTRLKHFFPLVKSRSASPLIPAAQQQHPPPAIITTSPTSPPPLRISGGNASGTERLSSSSLDNAPDSASSGRTSTSANGLFMLGNGGGDASQTRLQIVTSGVVAAAVGAGSNHIHFEDTMSIRTSDVERSGTPSFLPLNSRPSLSSVRPAPEVVTSSSIGAKEGFLAKVLPAKLRRRHRKQHHSVTSLSDHSALPTTRSAPASPK